MRPLVWFRADLRVRDNTALYRACERADDGVVGVFTICPAQWTEHDWSPAKVDFLLRNLKELSASLGKLRIPLLIAETSRFDDVPSALLWIAERHGCDSLWFNREYEVNERRRDDTVTDFFEQAAKSVYAFTDQVVLAPESLRTTDGKFYEVFTPFRKRWTARVAGLDMAVFPKPPRQKKIEVEPDPVPENVEGFDGPRRDDLWRSGESHALSRLRSFVSRRVGSYAEFRDYPAINGTSTLSPYLTAGVVSPRQCLKAARDANRGLLDSGSNGVVTWISELVWREFYRHVLVGFPRVCRNQPFRLETRDIQWSRNEEHFRRWQEGRTGYPIVDAAMRQLAQTGWMHNRLRMIVAMFLTKNLFIDWRWGERHFMRNLIDGDFASNNGGWQWSASVGTDAAPYFRVFNPVSQSERYDPDGKFIRRFVPELEGVEGKAVHMPAERVPELLPRLDYPEPIVDHRISREQAIEKFKALRAG